MNIYKELAGPVPRCAGGGVERIGGGEAEMFHPLLQTVQKGKLTAKHNEQTLGLARGKIARVHAVTL